MLKENFALLSRLYPTPRQRAMFQMGWLPMVGVAHMQMLTAAACKVTELRNYTLRHRHIYIDYIFRLNSYS